MIAEDAGGRGVYGSYDPCSSDVDADDHMPGSIRVWCVKSSLIRKNVQRMTKIYLFLESHSLRWAAEKGKYSAIHSRINPPCGRRSGALGSRNNGSSNCSPFRLFRSLLAPTSTALDLPPRAVAYTSNQDVYTTVPTLPRRLLTGHGY